MTEFHVTSLAHHFNFPVDRYDSVAQIMMFLAVVCTVLMGLSRRMGDLILGILSVALRWAFRGRDGLLSTKKCAIVNDFPITIDSVLSRFKLDGNTMTCAACPSCHFTYDPTYKLGSKIPCYPEFCDNKPFPDAEICGTLLVKDNIPEKTFVYHSFHDYLAGLLSRGDLERAMDNQCDKLMADINKPQPSTVGDSFDAEFIRAFKGPDSKIFVDRPGTEGRYLFVFSMDFFNSEGMSIRGPSTSCGIISGACLNLPLDVRYKPENMYIAGIIPGPSEPHLTQLNHYLRPLVDDLCISWERGVRYSQTACHPNGRDTRSAAALAACDLPAARKLAQCAGHSSHFYCSVCNCWHLSTLGRTDFESPDWQPKDPLLCRKYAEAWKNAATSKSQESLFKAHGLRWSQLWRLPYWDPSRMLVVDPMHCLLEGLFQSHFREVLKLTTASAKEATEELPAFEYSFPVPNPVNLTVDERKLTPDDFKQITQIHCLLVAPVNDTFGLEQGFSELAKRLNNKRLAPLAYVAKSIGASPLRRDERSKRITKIQWAEGLVEWVS